MLKRILVSFILAAWIISTSIVTGLADGAELETKLKSAFDEGKLNGLHSVLVLHKGKVFSEIYFEGPDERWGVRLGKVEHGPDTLHDLRSVTKSVVSLLYGIALAEGTVPGVDECLVCQFPEYEDLQSDPPRKKVLIHHALSMTMGMDWNEDVPYSNPENSEIAMEISRDRYRYVLERDLVHEPGTRWIYSGGSTAVISELIVRGNGKAIDKYAEEKLFGPLGITEYQWVRGFNAEPSAASGLRLKSHDLAKIGTLILDNGRFEGEQIVPEDWLEKSLTPSSNDADGLRYGYQWWLAPQGNPPVWIAGFGHGGQRLSIIPGADLVIVIFAGNYNKPGYWELPVKVVVEYVLPELGL